MIEVRGLSKSYGAFAAIDNVSFEVAPGETFALLGPNGSGKSTTLKCLVGLTMPNAGEVVVNGFDLRKKACEARASMSYLPQRVSFPESLTAREVMAFYCQLRKLPESRIAAVLDGSSFNFNGFTDKPVGQLSGGMVQRLGLAVACLPDAPILLLDEPTVSLDPEGAIRFREFLASLKAAGKTILFSSHVLADVEQLADRVAILVGGRLAAIESTSALRDELMRSCRMRIVFSGPAPRLPCLPRLIDAAQNAGAAEALVDGDSLIITSRAETRLDILRAIDAAGGQVIRFATEELSLENIYLKYIRNENH
jgi:Cu-processing system ATP-binding protein